MNCIVFCDLVNQVFYKTKQFAIFVTISIDVNGQ